MKPMRAQMTYSETLSDSGNYVRPPFRESIPQCKFPVTLGIQPSCKLIYLQAKLSSTYQRKLYYHLPPPGLCTPPTLQRRASPLHPLPLAA